ncbi:hypothetical protein C8J57DRAFT_1230086 [Mycena rebaudengoi]|nr:hypothetical protein C8J57DRAFT_1230086 [Mycena rebaudengoi]
MQTVYQAAKVAGSIVVRADTCRVGAFGVESDAGDGGQCTRLLSQAASYSSIPVFYALHGGGAGSWGVLVSATVHTFPTFNATFSLIVLSSPFTPALGTLTAVHAQHIFDLNPVRGGQYFYLQRLAPNGTAIFLITTFLPNMSVEAGTALMQPFLAAARVIPEVTVGAEAHANVVNDLPFQVERRGRALRNRDKPEAVGRAYQELLEGGALNIYGHLVAGGQVSANAHISSALHPAWRTAKVHLLLINTWSDSAPLATINAVRTHFLDVQLPIFAQIAGSGPDAAAYSNEADVLEVDFQATFFGPNYAKLSAIKDLFIVGAGVGSERWDQLGISPASLPLSVRYPVSATDSLHSLIGKRCEDFNSYEHNIPAIWQLDKAIFGHGAGISESPLEPILAQWESTYTINHGRQGQRSGLCFRHRQNPDAVDRQPKNIFLEVAQ